MRSDYFSYFIYYTPYTYYVHYFAGYCSSGDIGIAGLCQTQGSFCSVQLFGAGAHKSTVVFRGFTAIHILRKRFMQVIAWISWWFCRRASTMEPSLCRLTLSGSTPVLRICCDWHWIQVLLLCTCFDVGILRRSWQWYLYQLWLLNLICNKPYYDNYSYYSVCCLL